MIDSIVPGILDSTSALLLADAATATSDERYWRFLGRLHPLVVHFPIGLAIAAAGVELVNIVLRRREASPFALTATGFAAIAACFAAWFGWLNADFEGATADNTLFLHRWLGIAGAAALLVVWFVGLVGRSGERHGALNGYRWGLLVTAVVVGVGAHFGGEMVYGKGYLTKVLFPAEATVVVANAETDVATSSDADPEPAVTKTAGGATRVSFQRDVLPIFEARCIECHGPDKVKGSLRMDTVAHLFDGDPEWLTVVPGKPDESLLVERIELPADDPDAMPPKGDRLTPEQVGVIRTWIEEGATDDGDGAAAATPPAAPAGIPDVPAGAPAPTAGELAAAAIQAAVTMLRERQVLVMPVAQASDDWEVNASLISPPFGDQDLGRLDGLQPVLVWANFARSDLTDAGLVPLAEFQSLTRLRLDNTALGDGCVEVLLGLPNLEMVNFYGSKLTDAGLAALAAHPSLARIYCDETEVTPEGVAAAGREGLEIVGPEAPAATSPSGDA